MTAYERDLLGYGRQPPQAQWPGGARLAVNVVLNHEEGAEMSPREGDPESEKMAEASYLLPQGATDLIQESTFDFGSRAGVWRVLRTLDKFEMPFTVFAAGRALERNPEVTAFFVDRGCDFVGHGYRWVQHLGMEESFERMQIRRAVTAIEETTGCRIKGWFTRPLPSENTRRLLVEEGFVYDSDSIADDLPYYTYDHGRPHLVVPYSLDVNDTRFWKSTFLTGDDWFRYARDCFDALLAEGSSTPKMMSVGLHGRIIGRPARIQALERFLDHVRKASDVWFCRRDEIAEHWLTKHPAGEGKPL